MANAGIDPNSFQLRPARSPSRRDPYKSTHGNAADDIDRGLEKCGHKIWGFVIYRSTYSSDNEWEQCIGKIRSEIEDQLRFDNALDLLESSAFTVFDDPNLFDGASTTAIRRHFNEWAATAPTSEQGTGPGPHGGSTRYNFCLQVDEEAMRSIVDDNAEIALDSLGFVKLIHGKWQPESEANSEEEAAFEPIEGCTQHDVGWFRVSYTQLISFYNLFFGREHLWRTEYRRPPTLVHY